jgi:hypothetical protein
MAVFKITIVRSLNRGIVIEHRELNRKTAEITRIRLSNRKEGIWQKKQTMINLKQMTNDEISRFLVKISD